MRKYQVRLIGVSPMLFHHDNIEWADTMTEWQANPDNKKLSKAGDDRTPSWRWLGCLYHDGKEICVPQANIMRALMEGGAMVPVPGGRSGKTYKAQTQSGMMCEEPFWSLTVNGHALKWADFFAFRDEPKFTAHKEMAEALGFSLLVKRAKVGQSKHVRVRPQFNDWQVTGTLAVWDDQIDERALTSIINFAGQYKGLGDWRPGSRTPGPYGRFDGTIQELK